MIQVTAAPEPSTFDAAVRRPGEKYLRRLGGVIPGNKQWKKHSYWKNCLPDLKAAYNDVCAYTACWAPLSSSVDHFIPKSTNLSLAYEWTNFRLAADRVNQAKDNALVLDPFTIQDGWFVLDIASSFVHSGPNLNASIDNAVAETIRILRLNDDAWVRLRFTAMRDYSRGAVTLDYLIEKYPFVAKELIRQDMTQRILGIIS